MSAGRSLSGPRRFAVAALPAVILCVGLLAGAVAAPDSRSLPLNRPLAQLPERIGGFELVGERSLRPGELRVLRPDDYVLRAYQSESGRELTLFVAYYGRQLSGSTIHSPRNCLPGSGWRPLEHEPVPVATPYGEGHVNRYAVEHESGATADVIYWYQGRGRVAASEYAVKWHLVRDGILDRRTDEALVRLVLPGAGSLSRAEARGLAEQVIEALARHLPS